MNSAGKSKGLVIKKGGEECPLPLVLSTIKEFHSGFLRIE